MPVACVVSKASACPASAVTVCVLDPAAQCQVTVAPGSTSSVAGVKLLSSTVTSVVVVVVGGTGAGGLSCAVPGAGTRNSETTVSAAKGRTFLHARTGTMRVLQCS